MQMFKRIVSLLLTLVLLAGMVPPVSVRAEETEPAAVETTAETEAAPEETTAPAQESAAPTEVPTEAVTEPVQTVPETTEAAVPAETAPAETEAVETAPAETEAAETVPAETVEENEASAEAAGAYSGTCGDDLTWGLSDDGVLTISGTGEMTSYYDDPAPWDSVRGEITAISLEEGITTIGDYAFYSCDRLTEIVLPDSVTSIGDYAFDSCYNLTEIVLPDSVTTIGEAAFKDCDSLTEIVIPDSVTTIGDYTFWDCDSLTEIVLPDSVTTIGEAAFKDCDSLTEIVIPDSVTTIGDYTFWDCDSLTEIVLPDSVTSIGDHAFAYCYDLTEIVIPDGVTTIGDYAFKDCDGLTEIYFEGSAPAFGDCVFYDTTATAYYPTEDGTWTADVMQDYGGDITWVAWEDETVYTDLEVYSQPDRVAYLVGDTEIDLTGIRLRASNRAGDSRIISNTDLMTVAYYDTASRGRKQVGVEWNGLTAEFEIGVHNSGYSLQLSSGYPESAHNYGSDLDQSWDYTVPGASYLELTFSSSTQTESNYDYIYLYDGSGNELGKYDGTELAGQTVTVNGDTVTIRLTSDGSVTYYGFKLDSIYAMAPAHEAAGRGVYTEPTCFVDGYYTYTCALCGLSFTEVVEGTAGHRFVNGECTECGMPENALDYGTFDGITWVLDDSYCLFLTGTGEVTQNPWSGYQSRITRLVVGDGITSLSDNLFNDYDSLTSATIADSVTYIGDAAFYSCDSLQSIVLPAGLTEIRYDTFSECSSLRSVNIPEDVTTLGDWIFNNCALTSVVIPASVESIGYSFPNCTSLTSVTFQGDAPYIDGSAFESVTANVYYPVGNSTWTADVMQNYGGGLTWIARSTAVSLTVQTLPSRVMYQLGDTQVDLTGLELLAEDAYGNTWVVTLNDGITVGTVDLTTTGRKTVTVTYEDLTAQIDIFVHRGSTETLQPSSGYPESSHEYGNSIDESWDYTVPGAESLKLTFSSDTETESGCDYITLYDGSGIELGKYDGTELAGQTVIVSGDTVTIRLTTDGSVTRYGFSLDSIYAMTPEHEKTGSGVYTDPTCFEDGYYTHTCIICGMTFREWDEGTAGHHYEGGYCTECGMPENALDYGTSGSISWVLGEDYCLYVTGTGEITDAPWSEYQSRITRIVIGEGITAIGDYVFQSYSSVTELELSNTVTRLGYDAFSGCTSLVSVTIPDSVTELSNDVFEECTSLTSVTMGAGVSYIGPWVFQGCSSMDRIVFRGDAPTFESDTFYNVEATVYYPGSNDTWTEDVLQDYGGIIDWVPRYEPVFLELQCPPDRIMYQVGDTEFDLTGLKLWAEDDAGNGWVVTPADGITVVDYNTADVGWQVVTVAYEGLTAHFEIVIHWSCARTLQPSSGYPESDHNYSDDMDESWVYTVPGADYLELTFSSDTETESGYDYIYLYDGSGNELGEYDGTELAGQTVIVSGDTVTIRMTSDSSFTRYGFSLDSIYAFVVEHEHSGYYEYVEPSCYVDGYTAEVCAICGELFDKVIDEGSAGHRYEDGYCIHCDMPENIVESGEYENFTWMVDANNRLTIMGEGVIPDGCSLWSDYKDVITEIVVCDGINCMGCDLFWGYSNVRSVTIADSVWDISSSVFRECENLTTVKLPYALGDIENSTFMGCTSLESITIPRYVEVIEFSAFESCTSLKAITIPATVTDIGDNAFAYCQDLTQIHFQGSAPAISGSAFTGVTAVAKYPSGDDSWTEDVMQDYGGNLTWETFKANGICGWNINWVLTDEGELIISGSGNMYYFDEDGAPWSDYAEDITSVVISDGITEIGSYAFHGCTGLTEITIPDSVTWIGENAFRGCTGLTGVTLPEGISCIVDGLFYDCVSLTEITIPDSVAWIGSDAFHGCAGLTEIIIPGSVYYLDGRVFEGCTDLERIIFQGNAPDFADDTFLGAEAAAYYPASDPTWTKSVRKDYSGEITWEAYTPAVEIFRDDVNVSGSTLWIDLNQGGQSVTFSARTTPDYACGGYSWYHDTDLATVTVNRDGSVTVTPKGVPGEMVLTAGMNAYPAQSGVTIKFVALSVDSEEIEGEDPADINLFAGKSKTLKVYDQNTGKALTSKQIKWSMDPAYAPYATINAKGKLTAKKVVERVRIEAIGTIIGSEDTTVTVKVDIFPAVTQVEILENGSVVNGKTLTMDVAEPERVFSVCAYPLDTAQEVTWSIGDKKSAYASYEIEGSTLTVTGPTGKVGTVTIKATVNVGSKKTVSFKLSFGRFAESVTIANPETTLVSGESLQLYAMVVPTNVTKSGVTWSLKDAADKSYVSLSSSGKLKAKTVYGEHDVTVVATSKDGQKRAETTITILPKDVGMLIIRQNNTNVTKDTITLDLNRTNQIRLNAATFSTGRTEIVEWKSSKTSVATVENGTVSFLKAGTVTITAEASDGRKATVTVKAAQLASRVTVTGETEVASGKSITLKAAVVNATNTKVTWSITSGDAYAKISSSGKLTTAKDITSAKTVTVRATARDGSNTYGEYTVTVRPIAQGVQIYSQQGGRTLFSVRSNNSWWVRSNTTLEWAMNEDNTLQLSSRVYPFYSSDASRNAIQGVDWKSSSSKIATVDENGLVTCIKPGTTTITATAKDGSGKKVSFKLKVINKIEDLHMEDQTVKGGKSINLLKLLEINPTDATYKTFTWEITGGSGAAYASVNAKGVLKTKKVAAPMKVQMRATAQDGSEESAEFTVTINP